jgi:hypothetical protein
LVKGQFTNVRLEKGGNAKREKRKERERGEERGVRKEG